MNLRAKVTKLPNGQYKIESIGVVGFYYADGTYADGKLKLPRSIALRKIQQRGDTKT